MKPFILAIAAALLCSAITQTRAQDIPAALPADAPHAVQAAARPMPAGGEALLPAPAPLRRTAASLTHVVHGYHPYWIPDEAADGYRWDLLSHLAYFSYEVDPATGEPSTIRGWTTSTVIDRAKAEGVKVLLTVTNFGAAANRTLLSSTAARDTLITRVIELLVERGAHGVNLDFESVPGDMRAALVSFAAGLRARLDAERASGRIPDAVISVAAPAVDWNGAWDVAALSASVDLFFVMCYDYSWSGSANAGPVAPIRGMAYNVERSLRWYLDQGVPAGRLLMGVPYYGYDWPVTGDAEGAATTGRATARTYSVVRQELPRWTRRWSETYRNPWVSYESASWRQLWYDDDESLEDKYQLVRDLGIAGTGMWALGYDRGYDALWFLIERMFTKPASAGSPPTAESVMIWPQPLRAGASATMRVPAATTEAEASLSLFDMLGRHIVSLRVTAAVGGVWRFDVPALPSGSYLLAGQGVREVVMIVR